MRLERSPLLPEPLFLSRGCGSPGSLRAPCRSYPKAGAAGSRERRCRTHPAHYPTGQEEQVEEAEEETEETKAEGERRLSQGAPVAWRGQALLQGVPGGGWHVQRGWDRGTSAQRGSCPPDLVSSEGLSN